MLLLASSHMFFCLFVHWHVPERFPAGLIVMKFRNEHFYKNLKRNAKFGQTRPNISGTSHEDRSMFILFYIEYGRRVGINREKRPLTSPCLSVCLSLRAALTGRVFMKFGIGGPSRKSFEKPQVWLKSDKNTGHLTLRYTCVSYCWQRHT